MQPYLVLLCILCLYTCKLYCTLVHLVHSSSRGSVSAAVMRAQFVCTFCTFSALQSVRPSCSLFVYALLYLYTFVYMYTMLARMRVCIQVIYTLYLLSLLDILADSDIIATVKRPYGCSNILDCIFRFQVVYLYFLGYLVHWPVKQVSLDLLLTYVHSLSFCTLFGLCISARTCVDSLGQTPGLPHGLLNSSCFQSPD